MTACSQDFLCEDDFDAALTIFRPHHFNANATEAVEKIPADEKDYRKFSFCVKVCTATAKETTYRLEH